MDTSDPGFWNQLYQTEEYMFGKTANHYLQEKLKGLKPGKVLLPGDGEGRNANYCAQNGWEVSAFDLSQIGKEKADWLAKENNLEIDFRVGDVADIDYAQNYFDALVLIFAHFNPGRRSEYHKRLSTFLKPGGVLILEGFKRPKGEVPDIRYNLDEIKSDFENFDFEEIKEKTEYLNEGFVINGTAEVIQAFGTKLK